jgi:hypothetical protein
MLLRYTCFLTVAASILVAFYVFLITRDLNEKCPLPTFILCTGSHPGTQLLSGDVDGVAGSATSGRRFTSNIKHASVASALPREPGVMEKRKTGVASCRMPLVGVVTGGLRSGTTRCIASTLDYMSVVWVIDGNMNDTRVVYGHHILYLVNWEDQTRMYPVLDDLVPRGNYARKNIGYLYALHVLGACAIWDFDDDNCLTSESSAALFDKDLAHAPFRITGDSSGTVNPYLLYGAPGGFIWPRGMPMEAHDRRTFPQLSAAEPGADQLDVVQFMQTIDPDVDAIWRLQHGRVALPLKWDAHTMLREHSVSLGSWAPFNAQSTWLSRRAAMIAYLPFSVHGRVSDIWRSYIMQYLLGTGRVGFRGAFVEHYRNSHDYMADMQAERPLYEQAGALVEFLSGRPCCVQCSACNMSGLECGGCDDRLSECYLSLMDDLYMRGFIGMGDVLASYEWIKATGASFNEFGLASKYKEYQSRESVLTKGVVVVLHVNSLLRSVVPLWMAIHGSAFKEVRAYVPGSLGCVPISGIPIHCISGDLNGWWAYESMVHTMETFIGVYPYSDAPNAALKTILPVGSGIDGFLFTHDDVVWSSHRVFAEINRAKLASGSNWSYSTKWEWMSSGVVESMKRFEQRYRSIKGMYGQSDFYFVPLRHAPHFARMGRQMLSAGVFLEVAVPSILADSGSSVQHIPLFTTFVAGEKDPSKMARHAIDSFLGPYDIVHPVKLSSFECVLAHMKYAAGQVHPDSLDI